MPNDDKAKSRESSPVGSSIFKSAFGNQMQRTTEKGGSLKDARTEERPSASGKDKVPGKDDEDDVVYTSTEDGTSRCPRCGSTNLAVDEKEGKLRCQDCRNLIEPKPLRGLIDGDLERIFDMRGRIIGSGTSDMEPGKDMITIKCPGCGAEVVINTVEKTQARCPWCRTTLSVQHQVPNGAVPDGILPFHITRRQAQDRMEEFVRSRKIFAERRFKKVFSSGNIIGIYLPYMIVDGTGHGHLSGSGEVQTAQYTESVPVPGSFSTSGNSFTPGSSFTPGGYGNSTNYGQNTSNGQQQYTYVTYYDADVYHLERDYDLAFRGYMISAARNGNRKIKSDIIASIMPFDTQNLVKWNAAYLRGYTSEKRDVNISDVFPEAFCGARNIGTGHMSLTTMKYNRGVIWDSNHFDLRGTQWITAYLPVWLYTYREDMLGQREHYLAVNARTGKAIGSIPIDRPRLFLVTAIIEVVAFAIAFGFYYSGYDAGNEISVYEHHNSLGIMIPFIIAMLSGPLFYRHVCRSYSNLKAEEKRTKKGEKGEGTPSAQSLVRNVSEQDIFVRSIKHTESKRIDRSHLY